MTHEPYDENLLAHQEPIVGVSEWQYCNDCDGSFAMSLEGDYDDSWRTELSLRRKLVGLLTARASGLI